VHLEPPPFVRIFSVQYKRGDEKMKRERVEMRVPENILREVESYQERNGISTRTAAFLELVRKALEQEKQKISDLREG
jgi:metal-responsive CopG/Arc/MetJ family transcriptional regulator